MTREFKPHGPYEVPVTTGRRSRFVDEAELPDWWAGLAPAGIADKRGCYVFAMRKGRGALPVYVGMTNSQVFRGECFTARNLKELNKALDHHGRLVLHLIAPVGRGPTGSTVIPELERYLIGLASLRNPQLINRRGIPRPKWTIKGVGGARAPGRPSRATQELARTLGVPPS